MSVTKLVIRSAMIAGLFSASARADAILTLGLFSSPSASSSSSSFSEPSVNLAPASSMSQYTPTPTYNASPAPAASATPAAPTYNAFINFGAGSFSDAGNLTTGNAQAWYDSSKILGLFGGTPTAQQIASFDSTVLQRVQQTFQLGGVPVSLTDNPNDSAAHMLSVVSNTVNPTMGNAIGMTNIGGNGFHFIDNSAPYATSVDQLEWIVAHNVAHELMLAFGVPEDHDQSGRTIDSTMGQMSMFLNPKATFSTAAAQDLLSRDFMQSSEASSGTQAQLIGSEPVPEPATLAIWGLGAFALIAARRARSRRASAA